MKLKNKIILVVVAFLAAFSFGQNSKASTVPKPVGDFSEWQGNFSAAQVKRLKSQVSFVILRVQYGSNYRDKTYAHNVALMEKYKVPYGVYSFGQFTSVSDAATEAKDLYNRASKALFYVNDAEQLTTARSVYNQANIQWYKTMNKLTNKHIIFYSYRGFQQSYAPTAYKYYDAYWLAAYQSSVPSPQNYHLWQYTDAHYFSSIAKSTDASTIMRSLKPLSWWIGSNNASKQSTKVYKYGGIQKNWQVMIKKSATHWYNPRTKIPASAKNATYRVQSTQKITYSKSNEAVLLYRNGKAVGWALAQDISSYYNAKSVTKLKFKTNDYSYSKPNLTGKKWAHKKGTVLNGHTYFNGRFWVFKTASGVYTSANKALKTAVSTQKTAVKNISYAQRGIFKANRKVYIHNRLGGNTKIVSYYNRGQSVTYNKIYIRSTGYVWARYKSYSGASHYICVGKMGGTSYGSRYVY